MRRIMVLLSVLLAAGCATTSTYIGEYSIQGGSLTFLIEQGDDPLDIGSIISREIEKSGYTVKRVDLSLYKPDVDKKNQMTSGSGFLVSSDGYVITNSHVVSGADEIAVRVGKVEYKASVLEDDSNNDIALLKIDGAFENHLSMAAATSANVGDPIYVIGYPLSQILGEEPRISNGIVSAKSGIGSNPTRIQITASIQPGSSGGPVFDANYRVIGIATERLSDVKAYQETGSLPQNVNFGVKIEYAAVLLTDYHIENETGDENTLEGAIAATVQVVANPRDAADSTKAQYVAVQYSYRYQWDVVHYMLSSLNIKWIDLSSGELIRQGSHTGLTFDSHQQTTEKVVRAMLNDFAR